MSAFAETAVTPARRGQSQDPDAGLVAAARLDPEAFLALYERYFDRVFGYVRVRIADRASAEDVTSHVFTTALARLGSFRGHGLFAAWLFGIARNAVRDEQRRRRGRPLSEVALEGLPAAEAGPEDVSFERERRARLRLVLSGLRREQQHLLALRYGAGLSFDELAGVLGVPSGTARVRVHRIVKELRRRYPDEQ